MTGSSRSPGNYSALAASTCRSTLTLSTRPQRRLPETPRHPVGETQLPDLAHLLSAATLDEDSVGLLRDGTEALVGVLAMATGVGGVDIDGAVH